MNAYFPTAGPTMDAFDPSMNTEYFPTAVPTMGAFDPWYNELSGARSRMNAYFPTAGSTMDTFDPWYNELSGARFRSHHPQRANQPIEANLSAEPFSGSSYHEPPNYLRMHLAARKHPIYKNATRGRDNLYHCPFRVHGKCRHEPQSIKSRFLNKDSAA